LTAALFSFATLLYGWLVRRTAFFHDRQRFHLAHELKTPLHTITSAHEILAGMMENDNGDRAKTYLEMIDRNVQRLNEFVQQILQIGLLESGSSARERVNLGELIREVAADLTLDAERLRVEAPDTLLVSASREALTAVIRNLLSNAQKYGGAAPVRITAATNHGTVHVSVRDQGDGLPPETAQTIFEPYVRLKSARNRTGSGLGLAIAKGWVEAHGGRIWAESEGLGKGTTVTFTVPVA
jgi:two-component system phosphate regulon sensor histidine kinase PhoR